MVIATAGYEKAKVTDLLSQLRAAGVTLIVDVRQTPWSNRPDCRKHSLQAASQFVGVRYMHVPYAGNPKELRASSATPQECLSRYHDYLCERSDVAANLHHVLELEWERGGIACLLCYENHHDDCHRGVLVKHLLAYYADVCVMHVDTITGSMEVEGLLCCDRPIPESADYKGSRVSFNVSKKKS